MRYHCRGAIYTVGYAAGCVLLVACANLNARARLEGSCANVHTLRAGCFAGGLVRKVLVEFLLLAVAGGVAGVGVTYAGTRLPRHPNKKGQDGTCPLVVAREATLVLASGPPLRHAGRC
jgi:hypothetical protein